MDHFIRTALGSAFIRAHHTAHGEHPLIFEDTHAHFMLSEDETSEFNTLFTDLAHSEVARGAAMRLVPPAASDVDAFIRTSPVASEVLTRQRYAEDCLSASESHGITQYVMLGAGMDSYAVRHHRSKLSVFEVDRDKVLEVKARRVQTASLKLPERFSFVASNLEGGDLWRDLCAAGFRAEYPSFVSWLGVTPYLPLDAIRAVLSFANRKCCIGTEIVFDYTSPEALDPVHGSRSTMKLAARLREIGQPLVLSLSYACVKELLAGTKLHLVEHLSTEDIHRRYTATRKDGYPAPEFVNLVRLRVAQ